MSKMWCHFPCHLTYMIQQPNGVRDVSDGKKYNQGLQRTPVGESQSWPLRFWRKQKITYHLKNSSWQITEGKLLYLTIEHQMMSQNFPLQVILCHFHQVKKLDGPSRNFSENDIPKINFNQGQGAQVGCMSK